MNDRERTLLVAAGSFLAIAALTWLFGWLAVPLVAFGGGVATTWLTVRPLWVGVAGALAWGVMLLLQYSGEMVTLLSVFGTAAGVPGGVFLILTILLPFALAWSAAEVGRAAGELALTWSGGRRRARGEAAGESRTRGLR